jgi:flagellar protein FlaG
MHAEFASQVAPLLDVSAPPVRAPAVAVGKVEHAQPAPVAGQGQPADGGRVAPADDPAARGKRLAEAVTSLNDYVQSVRRDLQFSIDEQTGVTVIKVVDSETQEVIRQIPPDEILNLARRLGEPGGLILQTLA